MMHCMDYGTGAEEQLGLEECVSEHVEYCRDEGTHARPHEHVSELGYGRICQDLFNISLCNSNCCCNECRRATDYCHDQHHRHRELKYEVGPGDHKDVSSHHGCSVDQS